MMRSWNKKWKQAIALLLIGLGAALGAAYWQHQNQLQIARAELRAEYVQLMHDSVRDFYGLYGRLPQSANDIAYGNRDFRNPDRITRLIKLEVDEFGSLENSIIGVEKRAFDDVMPISPEELKAWQQNFEKSQAIVDRAGDSESKLRLALDTKLDFLVGLRHLIELEENQDVSPELAGNFIDTAMEVRRLQLKLPNPAQQAMLEFGMASSFPPASAAEIEAARVQFEAALQAVLETVNEKPVEASD